MRLGGLLFGTWNTPEEWALAARRAGYAAVYFPVDCKASTAEIDGYVTAAKNADLVISEIGVWKNTLDPDKRKSEAAIDYAIRQLELADYIGAGCCVNIAGSYNPDCWDGPHPQNLTARAFDDIVSVTQRIIDAVCPKHAAYSLEPMPWMYPDSADNYLALLRAVDRKGFAAHLDIVNVINSPQKYYQNAELIREWFDKLGSHIRSCHVKDIVLREALTVHLDECRPGAGNLDYAAYLTCAAKLGDDACLMLEHMTAPDDYTKATEFLKGLAASLQLQL